MMSEVQKNSKLFRGVGLMLLVAGVAVFAIRLQHAGAYAMPGGGNLRAGILALLLGGSLLSGLLPEKGFAKALRWVFVAASPVVFFFALYATLAELEEVVTLRATDEAGRPANLRLWIVDHEGASWVRMPVGKADAHGLNDDVRAELFRNGVDRCVLVSRQTDPTVVAEINRLAYQKYAIMRLATSVGIFSGEPNPAQVVLRFDPCERAAAVVGQGAGRMVEWGRRAMATESQSSRFVAPTETENTTAVARAMTDAASMTAPGSMPTEARLASSPIELTGSGWIANLTSHARN
jgi:hypothetical protein